MPGHSHAACSEARPAPASVSTVTDQESACPRTSAMNGRRPTRSSPTSQTMRWVMKSRAIWRTTTARYCLIDTLGCGLEALEYPACTKLLGPIVPGTVVPHGARVPGTSLSARSGAGGVQHWRDDSLARLQRHLAGRRVGTSLGQSRRNSCRRGLAVALGCSRRQTASDDAPGADGDDQGARDSGLHRARELVQQGRASITSCW